jgi:hypothetical protein
MIAMRETLKQTADRVIDRSARPSKVRSAVLEEIAQSLERIHYGEVLITIHDGRIVQIEKREKTRFSELK